MHTGGDTEPQIWSQLEILGATAPYGGTGLEICSGLAKVAPVARAASGDWAADGACSRTQDLPLEIREREGFDQGPGG